MNKVPLVISRVLLTLLTLIMSQSVLASEEVHMMDFTSSWGGIFCVIIFVLAYVLVINEEALHLRKSKPVMIAAGLIWLITAITYSQHGDTHTAEILVRHNLLEFVELFLFLLAAMTYINVMEERGVFNTLRAWLVSKGFSLKQIFWITGGLAFCISPVADNLTTALLMATVVMAVGGSNKKFVILGCINVVVAANAGGAFSPFGDITTLMVWQKGKVHFHEFFSLFLPSLVNWLVPAVIFTFSIPNAQPQAMTEKAILKHGALFVIGLFGFTIFMAVCFHNFFHLPPVLGMMTGLGFLKMFGYYLKRRPNNNGGIKNESLSDTALSVEAQENTGYESDQGLHYNIFKSLERAEWDTLMFFYGIILCVGGLGALGYLSSISEIFYVQMGPTTANILVGIISALLDNIPVMFAVLAMDPVMDHWQWLLVTLTAGVGGSLLAIGSAAGVAVMGQARGVYTFFSHLKWTWAIALGYIASILCHMLVN